MACRILAARSMGASAGQLSISVSTVATASLLLESAQLSPPCAAKQIPPKSRKAQGL